ncbi:MAG: hypothetical protein ACRBB0_17230 [Pelagimonas sp.]|uniref:glucuronyl esterase domain-containing protein n=1 Tax=Pelagimonas sp. TaxID=2073170 RepID=UPI003D6AE4B7
MAGSLSDLWAGAPELPDLVASADARAIFETDLYGAVPPPPDNVTWSAVEKQGFTQLDITCAANGGTLTVSVGLWLPKTGHPAPLVAALDFSGPFGIVPQGQFALDPNARVYSEPKWQADGHLTAAMAGQFAYRWPVEMITEAGFAVMVSCYGSWVPDHPELWRQHGVSPLLGGPDTGAFSLWAWALMRMVDVAVQLPQIDSEAIAVAGHSRLGKTALWAGVNDPRIAAVWANNSGCAGAAPARHPVGETLQQLHSRFPHWLRKGAVITPDDLSSDQHQLLALCAPRGVYLSEADDDQWADPLGSYFSLTQSSSAWGQEPRAWPDVESLFGTTRAHRNGALGYHMRQGGHDMLAEDWAQVLPFLTEVFGD